MLWDTFFFWWEILIPHDQEFSKILFSVATSIVLSLKYFCALALAQIFLSRFSGFSTTSVNIRLILQDICFKPLEPANNNCTITSVVNYWQNDPNEMNKTDIYTDEKTSQTYEIDYREHYLYCVE